LYIPFDTNPSGNLSRLHGLPSIVGRKRQLKSLVT
jgi:hypothetical protein